MTGRELRLWAMRDRYLSGDCLLLALAIHESTGWPLVQILEGDDDGEPIVRHALVGMPDGGLLDVDGVHRNYQAEPLDPAEWDLDEARLLLTDEVRADAALVLRCSTARRAAS